MTRFGLCCKFSDVPIKFRTTTVTYLKKLSSSGKCQKTYLRDVIVDNIKALEASIDYCSEQNIGSFRVTSTFFPVITHPDTTYTLDDFIDPSELYQGLATCKRKAQEKNIRLTTHPSQFILLSSPDDSVTEKSIADLEYHAYLSNLMGGDVINIHVGGAYGDKKSAMARVIKNFSKLSPDIQSKLTFENDDKTYNAEETFFVCKELNIPFVYDVHHHRCNPDSLSIEQATSKSLETWDREPLFHISSPINGWQGPHTNRHHDYINITDFPSCWKEITPLTIEVEAKAKELAIFKLQKDLLLEVAH